MVPSGQPMKPILSGGLVLRTLALAAVFIALVAARSHVVNGGLRATPRIASTLTTSVCTR